MDNSLRKNNLTDFLFLFFVPIIICSVGLSAFQFMHFQSHCLVVNGTMALKKAVNHLKFKASMKKSDHSVKTTSL